MMFIGQLPIPGPTTRLAYLFMTDDDNCMAEGYDPESGDTALLVQPGGRVPSFITTVNRPVGPSLWRRGTTWDEKIPTELLVELAPMDSDDERRIDAAIADQDAARAGIFNTNFDEVDALPESYLGGRPLLWQPLNIEVGEPWQFLFQLDCGDDGYDSATYTLNFGESGTGYGFLSPDHLEGRFYWDCI